MAAFVKYNCFVLDAWLARHNFSSDVLKIALTNTAPNVATHAALADITEIGAGNGYVAGGAAVTVTSAAQTAGVAKLSATLDDTITASGGTVGPARYAVLYNSTPAGKYLIGYWDKGVSIMLNDTDSWLVDLDQAAGVLTST